MEKSTNQCSLSESGQTGSFPTGSDQHKTDTTTVLQAQAFEAFSHDLEDLLRTDPGKWVAYRGRQRRCLAESQAAVYLECLQKGLNPEELFVEMVYAGATEEPTVFLPSISDSPGDEA